MTVLIAHLAEINLVRFPQHVSENSGNGCENNLVAAEFAFPSVAN